MKYELGVYIGRFQPFHIAHLGRIESGLTKCNHILVIVGSINQPISRKNPFMYTERTYMISQAQDFKGQLSITYAFDYDSDDEWRESIYRSIHRHATKSDDVLILGAHKDELTKEYLTQLVSYSTGYATKLHWDSQEVVNTLSASQIRDFLFKKARTPEELEPLRIWVPKSTYHALEKFVLTSTYQNLLNEE